MRRVVSLSLVMVSLIVLSASQARTSYTLGFTGSATGTATSGVGGGVRTYIGELPCCGIRGVRWAEQSDIPCHFDSYMRYINNGYHLVSGMYWNGCGGSTWGNDKTVTLDSENNLSPQFFVRGIAICDNGKNNHRLKGIRLYKAKVWRTKRQIDALDNTDRASHTNCKTWKKAVYCLSGRIATSLVLHSELQLGVSGATSHAVRGISLLCTSVTWK